MSSGLQLHSVSMYGEQEVPSGQQQGIPLKCEACCCPDGYYCSAPTELDCICYRVPPKSYEGLLNVIGAVVCALIGGGVVYFICKSRKNQHKEEQPAETANADAQPA